MKYFFFSRNAVQELCVKESHASTYEVLLPKEEDSNVCFMQLNVDLTIPFEVILGKGAFGSVSQCWYMNKEKKSFSVAIKRISLKKNPEV